MLKVVCKRFAVICSAIFALGIMNGTALAQDVDYNVNINSSLGITVPPVTLILSPLNRTFDHKAIDVSVGTNNLSGYEMILTSKDGATDLVNEEYEGQVIENLPELAGGYTDDTFVTNRWGWKVDGATNWTPFVSGLTMSSSTGPVNSNVTNLDFAAKIDYSQVPGFYSIALNFTAVVHPTPPYIQNLNSSMCTTTPSTVIDSRDNMEYIIQRLDDGNCWMMTNLNLGATEITGELNRYNTNIKGTVSASEFNSWKKDTGSASYTEGEYISLTDTDPVSHTPYGTLYNYHAASGGTVTGDSTTVNSNEDICPAGWRLPTGGPFGEFRNFYDNYYNSYDDMRGAIEDRDAAFTLSGLFISSAPSNKNSHGYFWSSTIADSTNVYLLHLDAAGNAGNGKVYPTDNYGRNYGRSIRCILNEESVPAVPTMQEFKTIPATLIPGVVDAMEVGKAYTMKDSRDNQEYKVAKLEDGNVWMLDNLRLGGDAAIELIPADTNIESNWTLPASGTVCFYSSSCTDTGGTSGNGYTRPAINADYKDTVASTTYGNGSNKFGVYYNYCAATAGTYCYASSSGTGNATQDICPAGWRMVSGGPSGEYQYLYGNYLSGFNYYNNALSIPLAGQFYAGSEQNQNTYGHLWTSTYQGTNYMYKTYLTSSSVDFTKYDYRYHGNSVRCVLKRDALAELNITTMQELNALDDSRKAYVKTVMLEGEVYTLRDSRDNQEYRVAKLGDGRLWMLDNLRLGGDAAIELTPADTNIESNWTLPASGTVCFDSYTCTDTGGTSGNGYTRPAINADYKDTVASTTYGNGSGKYGVYYNYCAASAGTYCYASSLGTGNATQDICPAGWRMPTGDSSGEYKALGNIYTNTTATNTNSLQHNLSTPLSGYFHDGSTYGVGDRGHIWSSSYGSSNYMYYLYVNLSSVNFTYRLYRYYGIPVRCVLK